jgi:hypothetical protein
MKEFSANCRLKYRETPSVPHGGDRAASLRAQAEHQRSEEGVIQQQRGLTHQAEKNQELDEEGPAVFRRNY